MYVSIDPVVLLKIAEHCSTSLESPVSGQLVGLDYEAEVDVETETESNDENDDLCIQISNCFPNYPTHPTSHSTISSTDYETLMLKSFRSSGIDHGIIGWYMNSSFPNGFLSTHFLETQMTFQKTIQNSIFICYDSVQAQLGSLGIRAFRITPEFVTYVRDHKSSFAMLLASPEKSSTTQCLFKYDEILEELPIIIRATQVLSSDAMKTEVLDTRFFSIKQLGAISAIGSSSPYRNYELFLGKLAERMHELSEYVLQEQNKVIHSTAASKKKKRVDEFALNGLCITELVYAKLLMLEFSKYVLQIDSLIRGEVMNE